MAAWAITCACRLASAQPAPDPWQPTWDAVAAAQVADPAALARREAWAARRTELGLGTAPWGAPGFDRDRLVDAALRLQDAGFVDLERALVDAAGHSDQLDPDLARRWSALLADAERGTLERAALEARASELLLRQRGSLLALLPPDCLADPAADDIARAELAVPPWRVASAHESLPAIGAGAGPLADAASWLGRARRPGAAVPPAVGGGACWVEGLDLLALLGELDAAGRAAALPAIETLLAVYDVPDSALIALAAAAYIDADADALAVAAEAAGERRVGAFVRALRDSVALGAGDAATSLSAVADALPAARTAFELWVLGETRRRALDAGGALEPLEAAIAADPWFAPALISRSSALVALGRGYDALADLQHLRVIYAGSSPYRTLIHDALDRRLR